MPCRNAGSKCQTKTDNYERPTKKDDPKRRKWEDIVALNARLKNDGGSECRNWKIRLWTSNWKSMMTLNVETKNVTLNVKLKTRWWLWTPKLKNADFERQTENRWWLWILKLRMWLWTPNRKSVMSDGSERRTVRKWWRRGYALV